MKPYRKNTGVVVFNREGKVLVGERIQYPGAWQFPQGGIDEGEDPVFAGKRELYEETGINSAELVSEFPDWLNYDFPEDIPAHLKKYKGQTQKWFLYFWNGKAEDCNLHVHEQEFLSVRFMDYNDVVNSIVPFKKDVYMKMLPLFRKEIEKYLKESEIKTIDCRYVKENLAAAFLIQEGNECAFVETNTSYAVPYLLRSLEESGRKPEDVKYIIITHVHLDHAGGTSELLKHCPNATVLAHPKTATHLISPERLVQSSITVYGEKKFRELYGNIEPVPEKRIRIMKDGEELPWGKRKLRFIYTKGHANHHFVIYDSKSNSVFTGDSFGISYTSLRREKNILIFPTTTPTDFEPDEALKSFDLITETGAEKAYLTHFGPITELKTVSEILKKDIEEIRKSCILAEKDNISDDNLQTYFETFWKEFFNKKADQIGMDRKTVLEETGLDAGINAMGLAFYIRRLRKKKNDTSA